MYVLVAVTTGTRVNVSLSVGIGALKSLIIYAYLRLLKEDAFYWINSTSQKMNCHISDALLQTGRILRECNGVQVYNAIYHSIFTFLLK